MSRDGTARAYGMAPPGYRLPEATRLGAVELQIADLDRSLDYYQRVIGMRLLDCSPGAASLGTEPGGEPLVVLRQRPGAAPVPRRGRLGLYHFAILLPARAWLARFVAHLAALGVRAGMSDHRVSEAVYLTDPDGLGIEVYADRPRESWRASGRELTLTTEPLDLGDLLGSTPDPSWPGLPAGTVIGHVHLHVDSLDRAAAFYHAGLGLDQMVWSYPGALFLSAGGYHHHLGTNTWASGAPAAGAEDARLIAWEIVVPSVSDARAALDSLAASGATVNRDASGGTARDPWGTGVRLRGR